MEELIRLLIWVMLFCGAAYGMLWVCDKYGLPWPVKWICGGILLVVLLFAVARISGFTVPKLVP